MMGGVYSVMGTAKGLVGGGQCLGFSDKILKHLAGGSK